MPKTIVKKLLLKHEIASEPNSYKLGKQLEIFKIGIDIDNRNVHSFDWKNIYIFEGLDYMEFAKKLVREHAK